MGGAIKRAIGESIVKREDLFITTKVWNDDHRPHHVRRAVRDSLQRLGLDSVDLVLIHWPAPWRKGTREWREHGMAL